MKITWKTERQKLLNMVSIYMVSCMKNRQKGNIKKVSYNLNESKVKYIIQIAIKN